MRHYISIRGSVRPSVHPSICPSIRRSVTLFQKPLEMNLFSTTEHSERWLDQHQWHWHLRHHVTPPQPLTCPPLTTEDASLAYWPCSQTSRYQNLGKIKFSDSEEWIEGLTEDDFWSEEFEFKRTRTIRSKPIYVVIIYKTLDCLLQIADPEIELTQTACIKFW